MIGAGMLSHAPFELRARRHAQSTEGRAISESALRCPRRSLSPLTLPAETQRGFHGQNGGWDATKLNRDESGVRVTRPYEQGKGSTCCVEAT